MADAATSGLIRRNALQSAAINAGLSAVFFVVVFGMPGRALAWRAPDHLLRDFLPQSAMIGLMSASVPVLASRAQLARITGRDAAPVSVVLVAAIGWALAALAIGTGMLLLGMVLPATISGLLALAVKMAFGGLLGAAVTTLALRRHARRYPSISGRIDA